MAYEQQSEQMKYVLQKETLVAEQNTIRAEGIASYQTIVASGVTERLLRWRGIEATRTLSEGCNPKLVVIGGGKGLSMIINQDTASGATHVQSQATKPQTVTRPQSDAYHPTSK